MLVECTINKFVGYTKLGGAVDSLKGLWQSDRTVAQASERGI